MAFRPGRLGSYCLKIHGKNIYGTVDPSRTRIFHFWLMMMMKMIKAARLYIYFLYGEISNYDLYVISARKESPIHSARYLFRRF